MTVSSEPATEDFYAALLEDDPEALYEQAPCGYLSTTPDGMIVKVNRTFLTWSGYQRDELVGRRSFSDLLTPGGRIYHETHFAPMLQMQGSAREIALEIVGAAGERLPALVNSVLGRRPDGSPLIVRTAIFDASHRRTYERELLIAKERAEASAAEAQTLARTLQATLLPPNLPHSPGLQLAGCYRPAGLGAELGGDFYDAFALGEDEWVLVIGDVSGKGVDAAVVTALARHTIRATAVHHADSRLVLETLNRVLLGHESGRHCTAAIVRLRTDAAGGWTAAVTVAGHPLPIAVSATTPPETTGAAGTLLGLFDDVDLRTTTVALEPGAALVLYTDGVTEARQGTAFFGDARALTAVGAHTGSAETLSQGLLAEVLEFQGGDPRDDIAILTVQVSLERFPGED